MNYDPEAEVQRGRLAEVVGLFLKLGCIGFGGPAAHISMMHDEVVTRRRWLDDQRYLDLLGATNLIPGPNSTEMAIHIGFLRAGWPGLILGGAAFILPAMVIVLALAWAYVRFGALPQVNWLLYGVKPVVIAIIVQALWLLGRKALHDALTVVVTIAVVALYFLGVNEIPLLAAGGLAVMLIRNAARLREARRANLGAVVLPLVARPRMTAVAAVLMPALAAVPYSLPLLFFTFLKIGAVLYGSGYVLVAFLQGDFVEKLGWLTQAQLLDAVAVGQVTPGPLFTTATFIGYLVGGVPGAVAATVAIFLPAFIFVAISNPLIPRMRTSPWAGALLDGVTAASLGLMAAVTWQLGRAALVDPVTISTAIAAGYLLFAFRVNSLWLILGGAVVGLVAGRLQMM
jgi:chromate transporter